MEKPIKKRILVYGLIFLLVVNLAGVGTLIYFHIQSQEDISMSASRGSGKGPVNAYIKEKLQLTDEQYQRFKELKQQSSNNHQQIVRQLRNQRKEMLDELSKTHPDTNKLKQIAHQMGALHEQLKNATIDHFLNMKQLCRPEQERELLNIFRNMHKGRPHHNCPKNRHRTPNRHHKGNN